MKHAPESRSKAGASAGSPARADSAAAVAAVPAADQTVPAIAMHGISKSFGSVQANADIAFSVQPGEIHALLGENGSGKSTLMNILSGIYLPDAGVIDIHGRRVVFGSPRDSMREGIGMIHQHFKLVENLTALDNILAGTGRGLFFDRAAARARVQAISEQFAMGVDPDRVVSTLSVSEKQTVEILKVLYRGSRILILDEPTAVLTPQEIERLFQILRRMRDRGQAVIFISHKLNEVMSLCNRVTVLRQGRTVGTVLVPETSTTELVEMMVGRSVDLSICRPAVAGQADCLEVSDLVVRDEAAVIRLDHVSFTLRSGEILGVAGLAGSGQKELCEAIAGLQNPVSGSIRFEGSEIIGKTPREIIRMGVSMSFIPEDRLGMGLVASMDIADNIMLKDYAFHKGPLLNRREAREKARRIVSQLGINTPGIFHTVRKLSGGNIQKVILGREINLSPKLLITAYAVRGLDINSSYTIYGLINEQKQKNVAVLYIGEDLDVLLELCDRVLVLCGGRVTGIVDACTATKEQLGLMMAGEPQDSPDVAAAAAPAAESAAAPAAESAAEPDDSSAAEPDDSSAAEPDDSFAAEPADSSAAVPPAESAAADGKEAF